MALRVYRTKMAEFASASYLDAWYSHTTANMLLGDGQEAPSQDRRRASWRACRAKDRLRAFAKLTEVVDGERRIVHDPPLIFRLDKTRGRDPRLADGAVYRLL